MEYSKKPLLRVLLAFFFCMGTQSASALSIPTEEPCHPSEYEKRWAHNLVTDIKRDFRSYFTDEDTLKMFLETFVTAGVFANTGLDRSINRHWHRNINNRSTDNFFKIPKAVGGFSYCYIPFYLLCMGVGHLREHTLFGNVMYTWAYRNMRTFILGGMQQVALTTLLGGGRPISKEDSKWQPFRYHKGVSGHAFYGAIPFLTAAQMTDPIVPRYALYVFSTLPALSRINSESHYFSQVLLGWALAALSAHRVYESDAAREPCYQVNITPRSQGAMLHASYSF